MWGNKDGVWDTLHGIALMMWSSWVMFKSFTCKRTIISDVELNVCAMSLLYATANEYDEIAVYPELGIAVLCALSLDIGHGTICTHTNILAIY